MRHGIGEIKKLNMSSAHRRAVVRNLMVSLLKCGKIKTTVAKASVVSRLVEKHITMAKVNNISNRRLLAARLGQDIVNDIFDIAKKFSDRNGGYTRITKTWIRHGDAAKTAIVELVI